MIYAALFLLAVIVICLTRAARFSAKEPTPETNIDKMKRVYIAGPMTGLPDFNYPAFLTAKAHLLQRGYFPVSPTELTNDRVVAVEDAEPWEFYMRAAIRLVVSCDAIYLLLGWEKSKGATLEIMIADSLQLEVIE